MSKMHELLEGYHAREARHHNDTVGLLKHEVYAHTDPLINRLIGHHSKLAGKHQKAAEFCHSKLPTSTQEI